MATRATAGPRILQDENLNVKPKKAAAGFGGPSRSLKTGPKKGGAGLGSRRALNDITNKFSSLSNEVSSKKKDAVKQEVRVSEPKEFNIAEERFLHDHSKCIEAQRAALDVFNLDMVLPGVGATSKIEHSNSEQAEAEVILGSLDCDPEPVELPVSEFSDWTDYSRRWNSPPCSPMYSVSPPWQFDEEVEFSLKQEEDVPLRSPHLEDNLICIRRDGVA